MLKKLESLFLAITFAEEGMHDESLAFVTAAAQEVEATQPRELGAC